MESGAKGCEVIVSGKLRAQRAKAMKFKVKPLTAFSAQSGKQSGRQCSFVPTSQLVPYHPSRSITMS
jgi:hypothetical protein